MKKILFAVLILSGVWAGSRTMQLNSISAQTDAANGAMTPFTNSPVVPFTQPPLPFTNQAAVPFTNQPVIPFGNPPAGSLTNRLAFTNTVAPTMNLSGLQMSDLTTLLLTLQTNVEQSLQILSFIESNTTFARPSATAQVGGTNVQQSFSLRIGTNTFELDAATLQAIVILQNDLAQTLPTLQALNGTSPTPTNTISITTTVLNPALTSFAPGPATNGFSMPLLTPGAPSAF